MTFHACNFPVEKKKGTDLMFPCTRKCMMWCPHSPGVKSLCMLMDEQIKETIKTGNHYVDGLFVWEPGGRKCMCFFPWKSERSSMLTMAALHELLCLLQLVGELLGRMGGMLWDVQWQLIIKVSAPKWPSIGLIGGNKISDE
jgi:hypothetical protein